MTTLEIIKKAKEEIEKAITAKNTVINKALDTQEYQFAQMGRVAALLDVAIEQEKNRIEAPITEFIEAKKDEQEG